MYWLAWRMLIGDRTKFSGIVCGVAFATLLMAQQTSIFVGIMKRTANQIGDVRDAAIWVMDARTRFIDEAPGLPENELTRVRGVDGVAWAVRLFKGQLQARLANGDTRTVILMGIDDESRVGGPQEMLAGSLESLGEADAVIVDRAGYEYMFPDDAARARTDGYRLGQVFEMQDHRAILTGVCSASPPFTTMPVLFTRFSQARRFLPPGRNMMNFILAEPSPGRDVESVCAAITARTGHLALGGDAFFWKTIHYFLSSTGIPVNFAITILLGFLVGVAIAGQTFYLFTIDNLKQFGALKAMGVSNPRLVGMIVSQALVVGVLGYGLGMGATAAYFESTRNITYLAGIFLPLPVMTGTAGAVLCIVVLAALVSIRKVLVLEPAVVFR